MKSVDFQKIFYFLLSLLTGFAVVVFAIFRDHEEILILMEKRPLIVGFVAVMLVLWGLGILISSIALMFSSRLRESAFLVCSNTKVSDELEEKAVNEAIKRTFIFNIALMSLVLALSGFSAAYKSSPTKEIKDGSTKQKREFTVQYSMIYGYQDSIDTKEAFEKIKKTYPEYGKALSGIELESKDMVHFIPKEVFSPFGLLCFILLQFISFRFFLFIERRAFA